MGNFRSITLISNKRWKSCKTPTGKSFVRCNMLKKQFVFEGSKSIEDGIYKSTFYINDL